MQRFKKIVSKYKDYDFSIIKQIDKVTIQIEYLQLSKKVPKMRIEP